MAGKDHVAAGSAKNKAQMAAGRVMAQTARRPRRPARPSQAAASRTDNVEKSRTEMEMDPVTLILTALAAGETATAAETASAPVKDAHAGLKAQLRTRLAGREKGERALARYETAPQAWEGRLTAELTAVDAGRDEGVVTAAQAVMSVADAPGWRAGKYTIEAHGG